MEWRDGSVTENLAHNQNYNGSLNDAALSRLPSSRDEICSKAERASRAENLRKLKVKNT